MTGLTVQQVAERAGCSEQTVRRYLWDEDKRNEWFPNARNVAVSRSKYGAQWEIPEADARRFIAWQQAKRGKWTPEDESEE